MAEDTTTNATASKILPIQKASIHRISSGQGILDLAGAVKELVENSLDAGANRIDIRLDEFGSHLIEVADNGPGVSPEYYQALTMKYYTSKLSEFADLQRISSFGFRGETLSSLCALAKVSIATKTADDRVATRIEYDHSGHITSKTVVARCVGTTVSVANLFCNLPVRLKELRRNIKREYSRLVNVLQIFDFQCPCREPVRSVLTDSSLESLKQTLRSAIYLSKSLQCFPQAYALMAKRVRLLCTNNAGRAGRTIVVQTHGNLSMRENVIAVFGSKTIRLLDWIDVSIPQACRVEGFLSKPKSGTGRSSRDRQYIFLNGRPVDLPKAAKYLNELYRLYNPNQHPFVIINFTLPTTAYDINVSPDKRKVFVHAEEDIMEGLVVALQKEYDQQAVAHMNGRDVEDVEREEVSILSTADMSTEPRFISLSPEVEIPSELPSVVGNQQVAHTPATNFSVNSQCLQWDTSEISDMVDQRSGGVNVPSGDTVKLKPFRQSLLFKSFRQNSCSAILSTASFAPPETQWHGAVQVRPSGVVSRCKRQLEESGKWPPLKKCAHPNAAAPDERVSKASTEAVETNGEVQEGPQRKNLKQSRVSHWFTGANQSSERYAHHEATSSEPERVQEACELRKQGRMSYWFTGLNQFSKRDTHQGAMSSKPKCHLHETGGLRSNLQEWQAESHLFSSASEVEIPSELPSVVGSQQVTYALAKNSSVKSHGRQGDTSEIHHLESGKQILRPLVKGSEGLKQRVSVLPFNRVEADEAEETGQPVHGPKKTSVIKFDMERLQMLSKRRLLAHEKDTNKIQESSMKRSFKFATVGDDPIGKTSIEKEAALQAATKELEQNFKKADFKDMKVLGQFELRFILAKLDRDIFIVDQHAADETYNFECLMRTAVVDSQLLPRPVPLELEPSHKRVVKKHLKTFRRNGFDFVKDRKAAVGQRLQLSAIPSCVDVTLGLKDMRELMSLLSVQPSTNCTSNAGHLEKKCCCQPSSWLPRPSRYRTVFASQACKLAKRVGDALSKKEMEEIVSRMAELEAPWTCPHGRPTIRHMVDLCS